MQFNLAINSKQAGRTMFRCFDDVVPRTAQNLRELAKLEHASGYPKFPDHHQRTCLLSSFYLDFLFLGLPLPFPVDFLVSV